MDREEGRKDVGRRRRCVRQPKPFGPSYSFSRAGMPLDFPGQTDRHAAAYLLFFFFFFCWLDSWNWLAGFPAPAAFSRSARSSPADAAIRLLATNTLCDRNRTLGSEGPNVIDTETDANHSFTLRLRLRLDPKKMALLFLPPPAPGRLSGLVCPSEPKRGSPSGDGAKQMKHHVCAALRWAEIESIQIGDRLQTETQTQTRAPSLAHPPMGNAEWEMGNHRPATRSRAERVKPEPDTHALARSHHQPQSLEQDQTQQDRIE